MSYVKVFGSLLDSSVWQECLATKIVWVTMLAMSNQDGEVIASVPGLAKRAGVTIAECEAALQAFLSPDKYSSSTNDEGRRIRPIHGGWVLINHEFYRNKLSLEDRRERTRQRVEKHRSKSKPAETNPEPGNAHVTLCNAQALHVTPVTLGNASNDMQNTSVSVSASDLVSLGGVGGSGGSGGAEVFDVAHPNFDEPSPPTRSHNHKPVIEETDLQRNARRVLHGGGQAQNARLERGCSHRWPEVKRILDLDLELRGSHDYPRTESDGRVIAILQRYAEGFTPDELEDVVRRARADGYWGNIQLKGILKDPGNFESMGKPRGRSGGEDYPRSSGVPIVLTATEAAKWR